MQKLISRRRRNPKFSLGMDARQLAAAFFLLAALIVISALLGQELGLVNIIILSDQALFFRSADSLCRRCREWLFPDDPARGRFGPRGKPLSCRCSCHAECRPSINDLP